MLLFRAAPYSSSRNLTSTPAAMRDLAIQANLLFLELFSSGVALCNRPAWATRTGLQEPCRDRAFARRIRASQTQMPEWNQNRERKREALCYVILWLLIYY